MAVVDCPACNSFFLFFHSDNTLRRTRNMENLKTGKPLCEWLSHLHRGFFVSVHLAQVNLFAIFLRSPAIYGEFLFLKRHIVAVHITGSPIRKAYLIPSVLYFPNYGKRLSTAQMP